MYIGRIIADAHTPCDEELPEMKMQIPVKDNQKFKGSLGLIT